MAAESRYESYYFSIALQSDACRWFLWFPEVIVPNKPTHML